MRNAVSFGSYFLSSNGSADGFIAKYDTSGNVIWAKKMGGGDVDFYNNITADPNGNIVATGSFLSSSVSIGNTSLTNTDNLNDLFVVSYDTSGTFNWVKKYGGFCSSQNADITCDASGNIAITGFYFNSNIYFGNVAVTNAGDLDAFIALYNSAGSLIWAKGVGSIDEEFGNAVAFDQNGNVIFGGVFKSQVLTIDTNNLSNSGLNDVFMTSYSPSGSVNWAKKYGSIDDETIVEICIDTLGNIYTAGNYKSPFLFWDADSVYNVGMNDMLFNKFDSAGNHLWAKTTGGSGIDGPSCLAIDDSGNLYTTGWFYNNVINLDGNIFNNLGSADIFVGKIGYLPTGIPSSAISSEVNVYPNPSYDKLYLKTNATNPDKSLVLYDMFGRVLKEIKLTSIVTEIERDELASGMYILEVHEKNVVTNHQKIILK